MKCKKCENGILKEKEELMVCDNCGSLFYLTYEGCYHFYDGREKFFGEGFEPKDWKQKYCK